MKRHLALPNLNISTDADKRFVVMEILVFLQQIFNVEATDKISLLYNEYRVFPRGKERPWRDAYPSPILRGQERGDLYLYSTRTASTEPVQGCTLPFSPINKMGPGSSVGIANDYGLDGPGSNPGRNEIFRSSRPVPEPI